MFFKYPSFLNRINGNHTPNLSFSRSIIPIRRKIKRCIDKFPTTRYNFHNNSFKGKRRHSMTEILTVEQVAQELQVNTKTVYQWIREKRLRATNIGTKGKANWRIKRQDLNDFLDKGSTDS